MSTMFLFLFLRLFLSVRTQGGGAVNTNPDPILQTIDTTWSDDYNYVGKTNTWISATTTDSTTRTTIDETGSEWHGPYTNGAFGITRSFYCAEYSSVSVSFWPIACGLSADHLGQDGIKLGLNGVTQCELTYAQMRGDSWGDAPTDLQYGCEWHALEAVSCEQAFSDTPTMSASDQEVVVQFQIHATAESYIAMTEIQIMCTPYSTETPTDPPTITTPDTPIIRTIPSTSTHDPDTSSTTASTTDTTASTTDTTASTTTTTPPHDTTTTSTTATTPPHDMTTTSTTSTTPPHDTTTTSTTSTTPQHHRTTSTTSTTASISSNTPTSTSTSTSTSTTSTSAAPETTTTTRKRGRTTTTRQTSTHDTTSSTSTTTTTSTASSTRASSSTDGTTSTTSSMDANNDEGRVDSDVTTTDIDTEGNESDVAGSEQSVLTGSIKGGDTLYVIIGCVVGAILCCVSCVCIRNKMNKDIAKQIQSNIKASIDDDQNGFHIVSVSDELKQQKQQQQRAKDAVKLEIAGSDKQYNNSNVSVEDLEAQSMPSSIANIAVSFNHNAAIFGAELGNLDAVNDVLMNDVIADMNAGDEGDHVTKGSDDDDDDDVLIGMQTAGGDYDYEVEDEDENVPPPPVPPSNDIAVPETTGGMMRTPGYDANDANGEDEDYDDVEAAAPPVDDVDDGYYKEEDVIAAPETNGMMGTKGNGEEDVDAPKPPEDDMDDDEYEYYDEDEDVIAAPETTGGGMMATRGFQGNGEEDVAAPPPPPV